MSLSAPNPVRENGVRVAAWPLVVLAEPPNMIDIVPTILDAAGITAPAIVGRPRKMRAQYRD